VRVGACQTPELLGDVPAALALIEGFAANADAAGVEVLLFPECFLQGYLVTGSHLQAHAIGLDSAAFDTILARLAPIRQTLVFGVIERRAGRLYNTAVVVCRGRLVGAYRKVHLTAGEAIFTAGDSFPVFDAGGVTFGINICYDTQFPDAAAAVAARGARMLLVPAQNMMRRHVAEQWRHRHHQIRAQRVHETGLWLVSADVTGRRGRQRVGYGPTSVINPRSDVVAQVPTMIIGMAVADIA
jgi:predicted amidohydrolase